MPDLWMDVDAAVTVPVNLLPLLDDTDFKTRETGVTYNQAGLDLIWNFVTCAGVQTHTAVTPTDTGGNYDWVNIGHGMYNIEIPASAGASINNDTEGFGWFTGFATGILPWRGPVIGFRAAGTNDKMVDSAYSATRGLAGTALPDAAADAAGGLPISDAGGLDLDSQIKTDIDAILVDTGTTLDGRIPAALTGNGNMKCSLMEILATALTETAGLLAGAFKKFFNVAVPTATCLSLPDAVPGASGGLPTTNGTKVLQTVDLTAGQSIAASSVPDVTLANGAHGGAATTITLQTPIVANATQIEGSDATDQINAAVDAALNTAIPGSPTADSINERIAAIDGKLPSKSYLTGTDNSDGDVEMDDATGNFPGTVGKSPATLAAADVSGNLAADVQTIKTQAVTCAAGVTVLASVGTAAVSTAQTGDVYAKLPTNFEHLAVTDNTGKVTVGTNDDKTGYALTVTPPTAADVKTAMEADGSKLDHLWETTEDDAGVRRFTTNALEQAPTGGSAPTVVAIRQEMDANSTKLANLDATVSSRLAPAGTLATVTNLTNAPTVGDLTAAMKASVTAAVPTAAAIAAAVGAGQPASETYAALGATPTRDQAILAILQLLSERSIASTTMTVKKLDGSTTAMTFTLDDATAPTSITRAT